MKIKRSEILEQITWQDMMQLLLPEEQIPLMEKDIAKFMSYNHKVPQSVLTAVLMKAIITAKRTHGANTLINEAYLNITFKSFVMDKKKERIIIRTASQAAAKLDKEISDLKQNKIVKPVVTNPDWVDEVMNELVEAFEAQ
ncbi:unknown [Plasmavirus L2]|uniref:Uncharacterized 16.1 kDa protein n=1 Tax=Acholeplasma phage L2 TaxID=46014 RepID=YO10_BPL2|nr:hypothetical protein L2_11 [Plasmavirus L2]P42545.1 RecName: Full=Uncharacterized 16.1 kDa protein; AltName: Full=ORF10 [Plasmavirus L2]AAA87966.1 unknown [Plasmavirus L2]